jgi:crotonobetainyl-CoA:carnitine CoA-transferase CaiB-like acyl-CoA transferase
VSLNLKSPDGVAVAKRLAEDADVVVESMRPGVMARLGLGHPELAKAHPSLIYCSISAYGQTGPYADRAGVDGIIQADSGLMSLVGVPDSEPCKVQAPIVDVMTGYVACMGVLAKLARRAHDGQGGHLDVNLMNSALALQQSSITSYFADRELPVRCGSAAPYSAPNQAFETADGWIMVAAYTPDRWDRLCRLLGLPQLIEDPRFATSPLRVANRMQMVEALTRVFRTRPSAEWLPVLKDADILCARVATYEDVIEHPQVAANRMIGELRHAELGTIRMPGFPINSAEANARPSRPAPSCGQDTREVLRGAGYTDDDIEALREWGAIHCGNEATESRTRMQPVTQ